MKSIHSLFVVIGLCAISKVSAQITDSSFIKSSLVNTDSVYTKPDVYPQFPGGEKKWNEYIQKQIVDHLPYLIDDPFSNGVCVFKFIIGTDGSVIAAEPQNMHNSELAKIFKKALLKGPKWIPAQVNGINVKCVRMQNVTFYKPQ
ncbi:hypothetical protein PDL71_12455 [Lacibacter sp. MH-610]|uniref:hypothetical protein n=1 Tax=Lacibacter sp. MH-610 TaxID=3020883 RepID=UPI00389154C1